MVYGQGRLDVKLGNSANPPLPPCTEGYQETMRRDPSDLSTAPAPENSYCRLPQTDPRVARGGARNLPCATDPSIRTAEISECPGGPPSTWPGMLARPGQPYSPPAANAPDTDPTAPIPAPPDVTGPAPVVPASWPGTVQNPGDVHTASVPYDPVTGNFRAPNGGDLYSITDAPHPAPPKRIRHGKH